MVNEARKPPMTFTKLVLVARLCRSQMVYPILQPFLDGPSVHV